MENESTDQPRVVQALLCRLRLLISRDKTFLLKKKYCRWLICYKRKEDKMKDRVWRRLSHHLTLYCKGLKEMLCQHDFILIALWDVIWEIRDNPVFVLQITTSPNPLCPFFFLHFFPHFIPFLLAVLLAVLRTLDTLSILEEVLSSSRESGKYSWPLRHRKPSFYTE